MDLKALIEKQRADLAEAKTENVNIVVGGEKVTVTVTKLMPDDWQQLVASCPPRVGATGDTNIGYDQAKLPKAYPTTGITVGGEPVTADTWADLWSVLDSFHRNNVATIMWGLNHYAAVKELRELGKAAAGQASASPANRESRRAASKGGSRPKSPATTTPKGA